MTQHTVTPQPQVADQTPLGRKIWTWIMLRGKLMLTLIVGLVGFGAGLIAILGYFGINPPPPTPSVVIAHIEHPKGREIQNEYVQIKNEGQTEVNLLG